MRRSKLESYEDILEALVKKPLTVDALAYETNMDCTLVNKRLDSLIRNGLVEERNSRNKTFYAITERGIAVLKTLNFQKYFEKVANTIRMMDEAIHVIPVISEDSKTRDKKSVENENY